MTVRCGKCGPCKRWILTLEKAEACERTPKPREPVSTGEYAAPPTLPERARALEEALGP